MVEGKLASCGQVHYKPSKPERNPSDGPDDASW